MTSDTSRERNSEVHYWDNETAVSYHVLCVRLSEGDDIL